MLAQRIDPHVALRAADAWAGDAMVSFERQGRQCVRAAFAAKDGWDLRKDHPAYVFFQVTPQVLQAWGTVPEMPGRTLMRYGKWLV